MPPKIWAMNMSELHALQAQVLWAAFAVALAFGWIAQRSHFCTMGALSDIVNMGDWTRMRMWGMAIGVAMIGFWGMAAAGLINPERAVFSSQRLFWLSSLVGGLLFGFGMVLASGCASKTLVRLGAGSLKSLVVFAVMGLSAFATLRGFAADVRNHSVDLMHIDTANVSSLMPSWLAYAFKAELAHVGMLISLVAGGALVLWALWSTDFRASWDNLLGGFGIGLLAVAMWWVSGHLGFVAEHPETMDAVYLVGSGGRFTALSFTAPLARTLDWLITSAPLTLGVVLVGGVVLGAWVQALASGSFHWEGFHGTQDTALHLGGAVCMGVGGITAGGCTIGQGLSGISTLSVLSLITVTGILIGGVSGLRFQLWLVMRD